MRLVVIFLLHLTFLHAKSQCLWDVILMEFPSNTAQIGQDSVVVMVTEVTDIEFNFGGSNFALFINNSPINGGSGTALIGDLVKIMPIKVGVENITVNALCSPDSSQVFTVSTPLPITYSKLLEATQKQNSTVLTWSVATQINNDKYIIEHSIEGGNFSPIGEIEGDGTSNITKHYEYIHTSPSLGINYYRIKQVDYNGKCSYSDIASVRYNDNAEISIYPNPATSEVTISTTKPTSVQIMDVYGRLLLNRDISDGQNTINISALSSGILIFVVGDQRYKVLKE